MIKRKKGSKKGDNGRVVCVAGSEDYCGAAYLCAISTLRAGADIVKVCAPEKVAWAVNALSPDLITLKLPGPVLELKHLDAIKKHCEEADVILLGCGIGQKASTRKLVKKLVSSFAHIPRVIDADAIKALKLQEVKNSLLTPHKAELDLLLRNSGLRGYKDALGDNVLLIKGPTDTIVSSREEKKSWTGNAGMTVGGTGDVLAGLCTGLIAQGAGLFEAATAAAELNGQMGDKLMRKHGYSYIASDLVLELAKRKL